MGKYRPSEEQAKKSAIENEKKARELLKGINESFHTNPEAVAEMFAFASNFYTYSPKNTQLIYEQNPYATYCQSYAAWKKDNAPVMAGQKGLLIWVRVKTTLLEVEEGKFVRLSDATDEQKEAYKRSAINSIEKISYKVGHVFDISQTTFPKERYPELFSMGFSSDEHQMIYKGLCDFSEQELGCPIKKEFVSSISLRGCYSPIDNTITVNDKLEDTQLLSTTAHELGHALIHKDMPNTSIAQKELEADALSIMLETSFGIAITDARKRHFKEHYSRYVNEVRAMENDDVKNAISKEDAENVIRLQVESSVNKVFDEVFNVYRANIDMIQEYVEKYLPREKHIQKEKAAFQSIQDKSQSTITQNMGIEKKTDTKVKDMQGKNAMQRAMDRRSKTAQRIQNQSIGKKGIEM